MQFFLTLLVVEVFLGMLYLLGRSQNEKMRVLSRLGEHVINVLLGNVIKFMSFIIPIYSVVFAWHGWLLDVYDIYWIKVMRKYA